MKKKAEELGSGLNIDYKLTDDESYLLRTLCHPFDEQNLPDASQRLRELHAAQQYDVLLNILPSLLSLLTQKNAHKFLLAIITQLKKDHNRKYRDEQKELDDLSRNLYMLADEMDHQILPSRQRFINSLLQTNTVEGEPLTFLADQQGTLEEPYIISLAEISQEFWRALRQFALVRNGTELPLLLQMPDGRKLTVTYDPIQPTLYLEKRIRDADHQTMKFPGEIYFAPDLCITLEEVMSLFSADIAELEPGIAGEGSEVKPFTVNDSFHLGLTATDHFHSYLLSAAVLYALFQSALSGHPKHVFNMGLLVEVNARSGRIRYVGGAIVDYSVEDVDTHVYMFNLQNAYEELILKPLQVLRKQKK